MHADASINSFIMNCSGSLWSSRTEEGFTQVKILEQVFVIIIIIFKSKSISVSKILHIYFLKIRRFPVPLSPELIQLRLENNYYRTLEGLKHDMSVLLSNAFSFFEKDAVMLGKMRRLSDWFTRTIAPF